MCINIYFRDTRNEMQLHVRIGEAVGVRRSETSSANQCDRQDVEGFAPDDVEIEQAETCR